MTNDTILSIQNLSKKFGGLTAVNDVCLDINQGEIYGLIGPNGAGKTTIFNLITGIITPSSGQITFKGGGISGGKPHLIAQKGIARTFQNIKLFGNLTVLDNVLTVAQNQADYGLVQSFIRGKKCRTQEKQLLERAHYILEQVGITQYADVLTDNLPYGLQRRAEIARALGPAPSLILLDEPAAGMNEEESYDLVELVRRLQQTFELTVLIIDHHMDMMMELCQKLSVLHFGVMIATGTPAEVQQNPEVIEAYLGVD